MVSFLLDSRHSMVWYDKIGSLFSSNFDMRKPSPKFSYHIVNTSDTFGSKLLIVGSNRNLNQHSSVIVRHLRKCVVHYRYKYIFFKQVTVFDINHFQV